MKKIFLLLGIIGFTFSARAFAPYASVMTENDTVRFFYYLLPSGDTALFVITSDSTVTAGSDCIDNKGIMAPTTNRYFKNYKNIHKKNVVVPESVEYKGKSYTVTRVADGAFSGDSIISVVLPKSVETIGIRAFRHATMESVSPLYCREIGGDAFDDCRHLKNLDFSRCTFDTLHNSVINYCHSMEWIKLPSTLTNMSAPNFEQMKSLKFLLIPPSVDSLLIALDMMYQYKGKNFPFIFLSANPPKPCIKYSLKQTQYIYLPCEYESAYRNSYWGNGVVFDSARFCHFLNLDSGYMDLDSVCPWEVERKYGFHPDTVGVYIVEKHNPYGCDSFNIYFVKSFLDPGEIYDTTINIEPNKEDTSVLWTWEGTGYAYNVYRDGSYITTVEKPYYLDTNIEFNVQYCYNFAPVNEKYCEGKWSTTNCYTMLNVGVGEADSSQQLSLYPNPAKKSLFLTNGERYDNLPYEVTDMTGRIVLQGRYNAADGIRVSGLAKGIYLLRKEGKVGKFVKE